MSNPSLRKGRHRALLGRRDKSQRLWSQGSRPGTNPLLHDTLRNKPPLAEAAVEESCAGQHPPRAAPFRSPVSRGARGGTSVCPRSLLLTLSPPRTVPEVQWVSERARGVPAGESWPMTRAGCHTCSMLETQCKKNNPQPPASNPSTGINFPGIPFQASLSNFGNSLIKKGFIVLITHFCALRHNGSENWQPDTSVVFESWPYKRLLSFAPLPKSLSPSSLMLWGTTSKRTTL